MKAVFLRACALMILAPLASCASVQGGGGGRDEGGVDVTRFHLGQPVARGQISIEAFDPADANMPEYPSYAAAVARQLARLGWTVANTRGQTEQVALIDVQQGSRGALQGRVGGGMAGGAAGASGTMAATQLEVRIKRRSDATVFWEGRAVADAEAAGAQGRVAMVDRLAQALFQDFPGESGRTIRVR